MAFHKLYVRIILEKFQQNANQHLGDSKIGVIYEKKMYIINLFHVNFNQLSVSNHKYKKRHLICIFFG